MEIQLFCDINNRLREMNQRSFLDVLRDKREKLAFYIGKRVMKKYGDQRTFVIDDIDTSKSPMTKFDRNGKMLTYVDYFKENYQLQIKELNQPLLAVTSRMRSKNIAKGGDKIEEWR
jgi:hypothetical protein